MVVLTAIDVANDARPVATDKPESVCRTASGYGLVDRDEVAVNLPVFQPSPWRRFWTKTARTEPSSSTARQSNIRRPPIGAPLQMPPARRNAEPRQVRHIRQARRNDPAANSPQAARSLVSQALEQ